MPLQSTACLKCGKETSEYDISKWRCLYCGSKFVYTDQVDQKEIIYQYRQSVLSEVWEKIVEISSAIGSFIFTVLGGIVFFILLAFLFFCLYCGTKNFTQYLIKNKSLDNSLNDPRVIEVLKERKEKQRKKENIIKFREHGKKEKPIEVLRKLPSMVGQEWADRPKDFGVETEIVLIGPKSKDIVSRPHIQQTSKRARSKLGLARSYLAVKNIDIKFEEKARKIFTSIVDDYPMTKSAELAKEELEKIK